MKIKELHYHRNGVGGLGFYVGIVEEQKRDMLVIRFPNADEKAGAVLCAAFDLSLLDSRDIRFGSNSFRGDHFADVMDKAIEERTGGELT